MMDEARGRAERLDASGSSRQLEPKLAVVWWRGHAGQVARLSLFSTLSLQ